MVPGGGARASACQNDLSRGDRRPREEPGKVAKASLSTPQHMGPSKTIPHPPQKSLQEVLTGEFAATPFCSFHTVSLN